MQPSEKTAYDIGPATIARHVVAPTGNSPQRHGVHREDFLFLDFRFDLQSQDHQKSNALSVLSVSLW